MGHFFLTKWKRGRYPQKICQDFCQDFKKSKSRLKSWVKSWQEIQDQCLDQFEKKITQGLDYSLEYCTKTWLKTRDKHRDRTRDWTRYSRPDLDMSAGGGINAWWWDNLTGIKCLVYMPGGLLKWFYWEIKITGPHESRDSENNRVMVDHRLDQNFISQ